MLFIRKRRNWLNVRRLAGLSILLAGLMLYAGQGWAGSWQHAVSSRVSTEFDSNPAMSPTYPGGVWRALFEPSYTLMGKVGENELKAGLALQIARSSNKTLSQNRDGPSVFFDWLRQSDAGEFGISSRYDEVATRDAGTDATGQVSLDSTRASRTLSASWRKALGERSKLSVDGAYMGVSYKGGTYVDYATMSTGMNFSYDWSESVAPFLGISNVDQTLAGGGPSSSRANVLFGLNLKISEHLDCTIQAGKSKGSGASSNDSSLRGVAVQYAGQRTRMALNADRQASPSGLGGFVTADQANGSWSYDLSEHGRTGINVGWRKNRSITDDVSRNTDVWLERDLNSFWRVRTHYQHRTRDGGGVGGANSDLLGLALNYTRSDF